MHGFIGPLSSNERVNSNQYLEVLQNNIILQLIATQLPMGNQEFTQQEAASHAAKVVLDILDTVFNSRTISHQSPDLHSSTAVGTISHSSEQTLIHGNCSLVFHERKVVSSETR
jgi:hypothetical protein